MVPKILERDNSRLILADDKAPDATTPNASMTSAVESLTNDAQEARSTAPTKQLASLLSKFMNRLTTSATPGAALTAVDVLRGSYLKLDAACPANFGTEAKATGPQVQSGFGSTEKFCAVAPLRGSIEYSDVAGNVLMDVTLAGLPSRGPVMVNWENNKVRGYAVAYFFSNPHGQSSSGSLLIYRPGETRGYGIVLTNAAVSAKIIGRLSPCSLG
jgi:hypothetical protein